MKKMISIVSIILVLIFFCNNTYAVKLSTVNAMVSSETVRPGEEVTVTVNFGASLGVYTVNIAYDNNIFEYVSINAGTVVDSGDKVTVSYYDTTGGNFSKTEMSVKFKAKKNITSSNPTEFLVTAENLTDANSLVAYDNITMPIVKNVVVEPEYIDYNLKMEHIGEFIKNEGKEINISYASPSGKYYEHARLIATVNAPAGGNVQILATDEAGQERDIIKSGWGDAQGFVMGGKDYAQVLKTKAIFSEVGNYVITLKLIDRDNSDSTIIEKAFDFTVVDPSVLAQPYSIIQETDDLNQMATVDEKSEQSSEISTVDERSDGSQDLMLMNGPENVAGTGDTENVVTSDSENGTAKAGDNSTTKAVDNVASKPRENSMNSTTKAVDNVASKARENVVANVTEDEKMPTKLPKTGTNVYVIIGIVLIALTAGYIYFTHKNKSW